MDDYPSSTELLKREIDRLKTRIHKAVDAYYLSPKVVKADDIRDLLLKYLELMYVLKGRI